MIRELVNRSSSFYARKNKLRGHCIPMFQRAMLLTVVFFFCQSVIHPMKWHLLLRATAYMKGNHGSITSDL